MQAIIVKYLGPTNTKGSRLKATCERGSITIPYPHELSGSDCHRKAVASLIYRFVQEDEEKYGTKTFVNPWNKPFSIGQLPNGDYVAVFHERKA